MAMRDATRSDCTVRVRRQRATLTLFRRLLVTSLEVLPPTRQVLLFPCGVALE